ncbi:MAG: PKD domain-containing protein [Anaerolineae bacterium]|nr:PKD domain-containing protein [Anaerolineae bacterium]
MLGDDLWVGGVTPFMIKDYRTFHHLRPQMTVTPQVIQAALHPGERVTPTLTVHNTGDAALTWTLSEQPPVSWLAIVSDTLPLPDALAPGANRAVSLVLDTAGMGAGVYTATLQVTGDDPATPSIPVEIRLTVCTAPAGIAIVYSPSAPQAGDVITFSGSLDQGTPPFAWSWTLGDGAVANGQSITHTYAVSGTYPVTLTITSACGSASTSRVLNVPGLAALAVQPEAIAQTVPPGATGTATVQLRNTGTAPLVWATTPPPVAWLAVAPQNGALAPGDGISLTLGFDAAGLSNGLYTTALVITSNDPERPGVTLPVTLTVTCIPATGVTLRQVTTSDLFTDTLVAFEAELAPTTLATPYSYTLNGGATQTGSLNPLPFDLIFDAAGTHTVTLAVWNCPAHAPVSDSLQVLVHARAAQMVVVAPPPAAPVYPGDTYTQTLVVSNTGTGMLAWSLVETPQTNWLSATPSDGVLTPQTAASVTLSVDATGMQPGSHPVTLTVAGNDPQRPATDVPLTLTVMSGPLTSIAATREPSAGDLYTDTLITWTVTLLPLDAARPYTYTLDGGLPLSTTGNTVSFTRTGEPTGAHTLVVAAWNPVMLQPLTETLHYAIVARPTGHNFRVYLPLVLR